MSHLTGPAFWFPRHRVLQLVRQANAVVGPQERRWHMDTRDTTLHRIAAYATILGVPIAILAVYVSFLQFRTSLPAGEQRVNDAESKPNNVGSKRAITSLSGTAIDEMA